MYVWLGAAWVLEGGERIEFRLHESCGSRRVLNVCVLVAVVWVWVVYVGTG